MPVSNNHHTPLSAGVNSVTPINVALGELDWAIDQVGGSPLPFDDDVAILQDSGDNTKQAIFDVGDISTATTRTFNFPNANGRMGAVYGSPTTKTLASDVLAVGGDRNIVVAAQSGTADNLIEVTGLAVGESVLLRADTGDTITVKHNDAGATVKIYFSADADVILDEQNPLRLTLVATNVLVEDRQPAVSGGASVVVGTATHTNGSNYTTSSTSFSDVDATNVKVTVTLNGGGATIVTATFTGNKVTAGSAFFRITDGTNHSAEDGFRFLTSDDGHMTLVAVFNGLSAGSTTFKLQFRSSDANAAQIIANLPITMKAVEIS